MNWITNARVKALKRTAQHQLTLIRNQTAELAIRRRHIDEKAKEISALQTENARLRQRYAKALEEKAAVERELASTDAAYRSVKVQLGQERQETAALVREIDEARRANAPKPHMAIYPPYRKAVPGDR